MQVHNWNCGGSHCRHEHGEVRVYPIGSGGNLILCKACWAYENQYHHERKEPGSIHKWDEAEVALPAQDIVNKMFEEAIDEINQKDETYMTEIEEPKAEEIRTFLKVLDGMTSTPRVVVSPSQQSAYNQVVAWLKYISD
jgi:hypothetical protein